MLAIAVMLGTLIGDVVAGGDGSTRAKRDTMSEASVPRPHSPRRLPASARRWPAECSDARRAASAGACLILLVLAALLAPWIAPYPYRRAEPAISSSRRRSPRISLGTDEFGRDVLSRIIYGARTSLSVSVTAIAVSVYGRHGARCRRGYFGGVFDRAGDGGDRPLLVVSGNPHRTDPGRHHRAGPRTAPWQRSASPISPSSPVSPVRKSCR